MTDSHEIMGGKVLVYRRERSGYWQCSTYMNGRRWRISTQEDGLSQAKDFAEDWFIGLKGKSRAGELKTGKMFKQVAEQFLKEYEVITSGERNPRYVEGHGHRLRLHLLPFFGSMIVEQITPGVVQEYRIHRMTSRLHPKTGEAARPSRSTLHHEIVTLRLVLKTANRHGWLEHIPDLSAPFPSAHPAKYRIARGSRRKSTNSCTKRHALGRSDLVAPPGRSKQPNGFMTTCSSWLTPD